MAFPAGAQSPSASAISETDVTGTTVTLEAPATNVVCLTGMCTDTLFVLGQEPAAALDLLQVRPLYWGAAGTSIPVIGGSFFEPSLEDIAAAKPDVVIGLAGVHDGVREGLVTIAPLFLVDPDGLDGMADQVGQIGRLVGKGPAVETAVADLEARIEADCGSIEDRRSTLVVFGSDTNVGVDIMRTPMIDALARCADYAFTFEGGPHEYPTFSLEQLLAIDPEVIFVETVGFGAEPPVDLTVQYAENPIWSELQAVRNGDVHEVSFEIWGTTRGIHGVSSVLDEALPLLYPDAP